MLCQQEALEAGTMSMPSAQLWFLMPFSSKKQLRRLGEWADSRAAARDVLCQGRSEKQQHPKQPTLTRSIKGLGSKLKELQWPNLEQFEQQNK